MEVPHNTRLPALRTQRARVGEDAGHDGGPRLEEGEEACRKTEIKSEKLYAPPRGGVFSTAVETPTSGRTIYVFGLTSRNKGGEVVGVGDIGLQAETVLENMKAILAEAGAAMDDVVKVTVFVRDIEQLDRIYDVRRRYFGKPYPASSKVEVSGLADPEVLIEIMAIAVVG